MPPSVIMQQQPSGHPTKPPRLKIILVGSAGAGKTSLLRRFVNGTFHGSGSGTPNTRKQRNTMSTLGADYYVKRVENPLFGKDINSSCPCSCCGAKAQNVLHNNETSPIRNRRSKDQICNESHVLIQLWDTRGLEPSPSYYSHKRMHFNMYQFLSLDDKKKHDVTLDDYHRFGYHMHRYNNWGMDTPSRWEGCVDLSVSKRKISRIIQSNVLKNSMEESSRQFNCRHNALFDNIDACMLVYDATSSTSFLRLMTCHEEWIRRFQCQKQSKSETPKIKRRVSFIVVANKIDLLDGQHVTTSSELQHGRSVLGFDSYRGIDEAYEYAAENVSFKTSQMRNCHCSKCLDKLINSSKLTNTQQNNKLTYSLKETCWSSDTHYLQSLRHADDQLCANRTMILLWCERNGIKHVETSALDGRGVDLAVMELVRMGLEERVDEECVDDFVDEMSWKDDILTEDEVHNQFTETLDEKDDNTHSMTFQNRTQNGHNHHEHYIPDPPQITKSQNTFLYEPKYDKQLDLFERYSAKEDTRCALKCWR